MYVRSSISQDRLKKCFVNIPEIRYNKVELKFVD